MRFLLLSEVITVFQHTEARCVLTQSLAALSLSSVLWERPGAELLKEIVQLHFPGETFSLKGRRIGLRSNKIKIA